MKRDLMRLGVLLLILTAASCGTGEDPYAEDAGTSNVIVRFNNPAAASRSFLHTGAAAVPEDVHLIVLTVSGPGIPVPIIRNVEFEPGAETVQLELQIPNGLHRTFRADAYDGNEPPALIYTGSAVTDLDGTPVNLSIAMQPVVDPSPPVFDGLLSADPRGPTTVELGWSAASDDVTPPEAMEYLIFWSLTEGGQDFNTPDHVVTGVTELEIQDLQPATTYYFVARARNQAGNMDDNTVERSATTEPQPDPDPPSFDGLQNAQATGPHSISLGWDAATDDETPPDFITYLIFVAATSGGQNFNTPNHETVGSTSYALTGLQAGTTYYIVVRSRDQAGNVDDNTVERFATTEQDAEPPTFNGVQTAEAAGTDTVELGWSAASDNVTPPAEIDYLVYMSLTPGGQDFQNPDRVVTGALTDTVPNLQPDTAYYFVVRARDQAGNIDSNTVEAGAVTDPGDDDTPPQFSGLQTAQGTGPNRIQLNWIEASDDETPTAQIDYLVYISLSSWTQDFSTPFKMIKGQVSMLLSGLSPGTTYFVVVRARDQAGNIDQNTTERSASTSPPDSDPPTFAGVHTATATGPDSIGLQWNAAADNVTPSSQIRYLIFMADDPGYQDFNSPPDRTVVGQLSAEITGLAPESSHWFVVRARDQVGNTDGNTVERSASTGPYTDWALTAQLPVERLLSAAATVERNEVNYVYIINGGTDSESCDMGYADGRVFFAPQNNNGTLGAWQETAGGAGNFQRAAPGVAQYDGVIYIGGGAVDSPSWDGNIWYTRPEITGAITGWNQAPYPAPGWIGSWPVMEAYMGYLYVGGGRRAFSDYSNRLYYTSLDVNGEPTDDWVETALPAPLCQGQLIFHQDIAYLFSGIENGDGGNTNKVYMADVNPDGSLGAWSETTPLPEITNHVSAHEYGGYIFAIPGGEFGTSLTSSVYNAQIFGGLGWSAENSVPEVVYPADQGIIVDGYYYLIGDQACSASSEKLRRVRFQEYSF